MLKLTLKRIFIDVLYCIFHILARLTGGLLLSAPIAFAAIPLACTERGYFAIGGEWLIISAAFIIGAYMAGWLLD